MDTRTQPNPDLRTDKLEGWKQKKKKRDCYEIQGMHEDYEIKVRKLNMGKKIKLYNQINFWL